MRFVTGQGLFVKFSFCLFSEDQSVLHGCIRAIRIYRPWNYAVGMRFAFSQFQISR